jgi:hypothetical protein
MTNQNAIDNNIFGLFANDENYANATTAIKKAADNLIAVMKQHSDAGATDTESVESIICYITDSID